jgi:hypothetical protein
MFRTYDFIYQSKTSMLVFANDSNLITETSNIKLDLSLCLIRNGAGTSYKDLITATNVVRTRFPCMLMYSCYRTPLTNDLLVYENINGLYSMNMNCSLTEIVRPQLQAVYSTNFFKVFFLNFNPSDPFYAC